MFLSTDRLARMSISHRYQETSGRTSNLKPHHVAVPRAPKPIDHRPFQVPSLPSSRNSDSSQEELEAEDEVHEDEERDIFEVEDPEADNSDASHMTLDSIRAPASPVTPPPSVKKKQKKTAKPKPLRANLLGEDEERSAHGNGRIAAPGFMVREETL
jgi:hypothetical protein